MKRLALVTDAWHPQTNGVVNTLTRLVNDLSSRGTDVLVLSPDKHRTVPLPSYSEYRIAIDPWKAMRDLHAFSPDAIHIATEGPLGFWVNGHLRRRRLSFTTSFHTRFPEYLSARLPFIPLAFGYCIERWFHRPAAHTLVGTVSLMKELDARRIGGKLVHWPRGVDLDRFRPDQRRDDVYDKLPGPIWLYVGRVAAEKTLADFLRLPLEGTKVVVGDGPDREPLARRFPDVVWRGYRYGDDLAAHFASADCFVFPSRTETFGNVILEALASGIPVASVPAPGPIDLIQEGVNGSVNDDLMLACMRAIRCTSDDARKSTRSYTYQASHAQFRAHLVPLIKRLPAPSEATVQGAESAAPSALTHA